MKKTTLFLLLALAFCAAANAQITDQKRYDDELARIRKDMSLSYGCNDCVDVSNIPAYDKAPKGYEPFYIWHYSRHGSRYAWNKETYRWLARVFREQGEAANLTAHGEAMAAKIIPFAENALPYYGELTRKGWAQHNANAHFLYSRFPKFFKADPRIESCSSGGYRSIMSEASFFLGLKECNPKLDIYEQLSSRLFKYAVPADGLTREQRTAKPNKIDWSCTEDEFWSRHFDRTGYLSKLFKDPFKAAPTEADQRNLISELWTLYIGTESLDYEVDLDGLFTQEELEAQCMIDRFQSYAWGYDDIYSYSPAVKAIVENVEEFKNVKRPQMRAAFGHDYVLLRLYQLIKPGIFAEKPATPEDTFYLFPLDEIPMGCFIDLVFYRSKKNGEILVQCLMNGKQTTLPYAEVAKGFYSYSEFREFVDTL